jgi:hypothetical protein
MTYFHEEREKGERILERKTWMKISLSKREQK